MRKENGKDEVESWRPSLLRNNESNEFPSFFLYETIERKEHITINTFATFRDYVSISHCNLYIFLSQIVSITSLEPETGFFHEDLPFFSLNWTASLRNILMSFRWAQIAI